MSDEKWIIHPGQTRVIDIETIAALKVGLVGGQVDIVAHDAPGARIEVHAVSGKDLRIETNGDAVEIDHPQLRWDNFLDVFRGFGAGGPKAEISVAVPRTLALTLGVVSASALVSGLRADAKLNTVSGDVLADGLTGAVSVNAVSGDVQMRDLTGSLTANSVSGDVTVSGALRRVSIDTVSAAMLVDAEGDLDSVSLNTVGGRATVRLDEGLPAAYVIRSVSGRVQVDGIVRSGTGFTTGYTGSVGELSGRFADVRANSVSGEITVLRRPVAPAADRAADHDGEVGR